MTADLAPLTISVKEAAQITGLSTATVYDRVRGGQIKARYEGRKVLVLYAALAAYIDALPADPA